MPSDRQLYARALNDVALRYGRMQRDTLRQIWKLLQQVEAEIQRDLLSAEGFRQFQLTELLRGIERYIAAFDDKANAALRAGLAQSFQFGGAYVTDPLDAIGVGVGFFEPTPAMMNVIVEASADLVTGISEPLLRFVNLQVRQVALQQIAPIDAMRNISNNIGFVSMRPGRETVKGIAYNAERIIRTEMGRAFNLASHSQQLVVAERVPGMLKRWVASGDARTRESHLAAHMRYLANPIPVSEPFHVGGSLLMYPGDPNGALSEIINCRCRTLGIHPRVGVLDTPLDARISDELGRRREALLGALLLLHQRPSLNAQLAVRMIGGIYPSYVWRLSGGTPPPSTSASRRPASR